MATYVDEFFDDLFDKTPKPPKKIKAKEKRRRKKADHKHIYVPVLLVNDFGDGRAFYSAGSECVKCKYLVHGFPKRIHQKFEDYAEEYKDDLSIDLIKSFGEQEQFKKVELAIEPTYDFATRTYQ